MGQRVFSLARRQGGIVRKFRGNPWAVLIVVSLGFFMTLLDNTFPCAKISTQRYPGFMTHESPEEKP
jgi:hypothetical protein